MLKVIAREERYLIDGRYYTVIWELEMGEDAYRVNFQSDDRKVCGHFKARSNDDSSRVVDEIRKTVLEQKGIRRV